MLFAASAVIQQTLNPAYLPSDQGSSGRGLPAAGTGTQKKLGECPGSKGKSKSSLYPAKQPGICSLRNSVRSEPSGCQKNFFRNLFSLYGCLFSCIFLSSLFYHSPTSWRMNEFALQKFIHCLLSTFPKSHEKISSDFKPLSARSRNEYRSSLPEASRRKFLRSPR